MTLHQQDRRLEKKTVGSSVNLVEHPAGPPRFSGYAAIFDTVDQDGDRLVAETFKESLASNPQPVLLWQHDPTSPIGRFTDMRIEEKGLYVEAELSATGKGKEAYDLIKLGALDGLSVGFVTKEASRDASTGVRTVKKAALAEISLVTFPAHEEARVLSVKSASKRPACLASKVVFERFLREAGISRRDARSLVAKGFNGLSDQPESSDPQNQPGPLSGHLSETAPADGNQSEAPQSDNQAPKGAPSDALILCDITLGDLILTLRTGAARLRQQEL